jgi:hypothetical protein
MSEQRLVDVTGRLRSPAATPGHWTGWAPPNKGSRYPADPPTVEEIILVMRQAGPGPTRAPLTHTSLNWTQRPADIARTPLASA